MSATGNRIYQPEWRTRRQFSVFGCGEERRSGEADALTSHQLTVELVGLGVIALVACWAVFRFLRRLVRRARVSVAFRPLRSARLIGPALVKLVALGLVVVALIANTGGIEIDMAGLVAGGGIAFLAIRSSHFRQDAKGWVYRAHPLIGIALFLVFLFRLADRILAVAQHLPSAATLQQALSGSVAAGTQVLTRPLEAIAADPASRAIAVTLVAYYLVYDILLFFRARALGT